MTAYLDLVRLVLNEGVLQQNRTGVEALVYPGGTIRHSFEHGFPLLTSKHVSFPMAVSELLWFLSGSVDPKDISHPQMRKIWENWVKEDKTIGPGYGFQWRHWPGPSGSIDQVSEVIKTLRKDPSSRRAMIMAWNPGFLDEMALPPCHFGCHFTVIENKLWISVFQRSADLALGVPFNLVHYSLLVYIIAREVGLKPGGITWFGSNVHIYKNHVDGLWTQLSRTPLPLPEVKIVSDAPSWDKLTSEHFVLKNYNPHPAIKFDIAV